MNRKPSRVASAALAAGASVAIGWFLALPASGDAPARSGRVVRVERPRVAGNGLMRGCLGLSLDVHEFTCFGASPPQVDERVLVVDEVGAIGVAEVSSVKVSPHDQCGAGVAHDIKVKYLQAPRRRSGGGPGALAAVSGLRNDGVAPRLLRDPSSVPSPSGRAEQVWLAVDRDADGEADAVATAREGCEEGVAALQTSSGQRYHGMCLDYYLHEQGEWERVSTDTYVICF